MSTIDPSTSLAELVTSRPDPARTFETHTLDVRFRIANWASTLTESLDS